MTAAPAQQQASDAPAPDYRFARPQVTVEQAADTLFALAANEALYLRLTDERGWTNDQYAQLLETLLTHLATQNT